MIIFPDPLLVSLSVIRAAAHPELAALTYGTKTPDEMGDDFPGTPYAAFSLVGQASRYPFTERATVRISVWGETPAKAYRLAQMIRAALVFYDGPSGSFRGAGGGLIAVDPDTGNPMAFIDVSLRLRPETA